MGNLPHNVRCLVEAFNTSRSNGNIPNNPTYLHVFVPWGKGKADVTQGEHCQLWGTDHRVWGLGGLGWGSGTGPAGLLELLLLETKQALPSSRCVLLWPNTASMFTLINIPHASKPSAFLSWHTTTTDSEVQLPQMPNTGNSSIIPQFVGFSGLWGFKQGL